MSKKQIRIANQKLREFRFRLAIEEAKAAESQAIARRNITSIARDLLPVAAALARKGRPRLLAVVSKILADPNLSANLKAAKLL